MLSELIQVLQRTPSIEQARALFENRRVYLIGNGGSAAVASHIANDLMGMLRPAMTLTDAPSLTAAANDFGWEDGYARQIAALTKPEDLLVAISSSGRSENILKACRSTDAKILTLSGFDADNPLRKMGDVNLWVDSHNYGVVEIAHLAMLHEIVRP